MQITFLGATGTVTGSKYLLSWSKTNILVDCGLFQGPQELRLRNWNPLPFNPKELNAAVLTHAHIDHSGYLPLLVKNGFNKPIYCTYGTKDLCDILLPDSARLQEEDAKHANEHLYSKHRPALPLYGVEDAENALKLFQPQAYNKIINLPENINLQLIPAGHIIGSSFVHIQDQNTSLLFSGDLGRTHDPVMKKPTEIKQVDYLVLESTYGDRLHEKEPPKLTLKNIINKTIHRGGSVIIPAFAVGRSQTILHYLAELRKENAIPNVPIFLDSPMAINATQILYSHIEDLRLTQNQCQELCNVATYVKEIGDSIKLDRDKTPKIILSASGMASGGRVVFHISNYASDSANTLLFTGFQAEETLGAELVAGKKFIEIHGKTIPVKAQIEVIRSTSAHADYGEILGWLSQFQEPPKKTFITHGEPEAALSLKHKIETQLGWQCNVPEYGQKEKL
ncbi:MBL fold metallo-hydrolase [Fluoribacter dumoffii]|uniref:Ribonuclease TTHA0252 n=1 Tax=Fluoribacter dumoffii TaxID=463 RepID=A0A377G986_9GAMM|nr:MBL fold metallo-hydrolase [Fluoribacter dumoffii]KTC90247.1 metallo-beta lactamase family transporter protein [Fluoribacter dumoffii NY 23]MCW8385565.1 MBL fold metallo-hydrolase [Fluoribacter dumoffii]MCW8453564.1 MBL fold metallo-hydrolase [Fluoribacter dumoffii]MCW8459217.1 MBL fold metallo-hydrolase [Fluoribacter dumoffii]MCW8482576.1 MBL fold metallo-hydrolase [Fluoribacter dumoffii]